MANPFEDDDEALVVTEETTAAQRPKTSTDHFIPSSNDISNKIVQGFVCPICFQNFENDQDLLSHFDESHKGEEPQKLASSLKGILGKAKKIFETENDPPSSRLDKAKMSNNSIADLDEYYKAIQTIGPTRNHWSIFKKKRDARVESIIIETNKLMVRLDKLLREAPQDPKDQKLHEKNVVKWAEDDYVNLCPQCAKNFNLSRRRHHCRLCGGIMCHNCSRFLEPNYANQLISPIDLETSQLMTTASDGGKLQRRGSIISLPAISSSSSEPQIRVCRYCRELLDKRNQQMYEMHSRPLICQLYENFHEYVFSAEKLIKQYYLILDTLRNGEATSYRVELAHGQEVKTKLMALTEKIDGISRKINCLGSQSDIPISDTQKKLQSRIRAAAVNFMHNNLSGLPSLPSIDELEKNERFSESFRQPLNSRQNQDQLRKSLSLRSSRPNQLSNASDDGWTPEIKVLTREEIEDMDPMLVQINQIKDFIQMARKANKYDEAKMLEANLRELEIEFMMKSIPPCEDTNQSS